MPDDAHSYDLAHWMRVAVIVTVTVVRFLEVQTPAVWVVNPGSEGPVLAQSLFPILSMR